MKYLAPLLITELHNSNFSPFFALLKVMKKIDMLELRYSQGTALYTWRW